MNLKIVGPESSQPPSVALAMPIVIKVAIADVRAADSRRPVDRKVVAQLVFAIQEVGFQTPISVRALATGKFDLLDGAHRLAAARDLGWGYITAFLIEGDEPQAEKAGISGNLHRADLLALDRAEHIVGWMNLHAEYLKSDQLEPKSKTAQNPRGGGRRPNGINTLARKLEIEASEAKRAIRIAAITPEAKRGVRDAGLANNQAALLRIASQKGAAGQLTEVLQTMLDSEGITAAKKMHIPASQSETEAEWLSAFQKLWGRADPQWRERALSQIQPRESPTLQSRVNMKTLHLPGTDTLN